MLPYSTPGPAGRGKRDLVAGHSDARLAVTRLGANRPGPVRLDRVASTCEAGGLAARLRPVQRAQPWSRSSHGPAMHTHGTGPTAARSNAGMGYPYASVSPLRGQTTRSLCGSWVRVSYVSPRATRPAREDRGGASLSSPSGSGRSAEPGAASLDPPSRGARTLPRCQHAVRRALAHPPLPSGATRRCVEGRRSQQVIFGTCRHIRHATLQSRGHGSHHGGSE